MVKGECLCDELGQTLGQSDVTALRPVDEMRDLNNNNVHGGKQDARVRRAHASFCSLPGHVR